MDFGFFDCAQQRCEYCKSLRATSNFGSFWRVYEYYLNVLAVAEAMLGTFVWRDMNKFHSKCPQENGGIFARGTVWLLNYRISQCRLSFTFVISICHEMNYE